MPTQLTRQAVTSSKAHESTSMDQSRRREMVCNLLTQIFVLAERTRAAKYSRRRHVLEEEDDRGPISLIELIQASYSVFERYGIGPPDDAVYHRYLLSLSINPDRDWRKKISSFDLGTQPKVKRLCSHQHAATINEESVVNSTGTQRRQRTESKRSQVRRASLLSQHSTPLRKSALIFNGENHGQRDRFGDMLSLDSPIQRIRLDVEERRRAFSTGTTASKSPNNKTRGIRRVVPLLDSELSNSEESSPLTGENFAKHKERVAAGERQCQMITTSIEQWRATQAVKQLVNQRKLQQFTTPICIHALFHWVTLTLPEKLAFNTTESPRALPLCVVRRIAVDVKVLNNFAQKLWVWQTKTLLKEWQENSRKHKHFRVQMIIKQRAAVLETAFQCIQRWRLFTETKQCSTDRAQWITQRCSRSKLRNCLQLWRLIFRTRQQQNGAVQHHTKRVFREVLQSWKRVSESKRDERSRYEIARKRRVFSRWKLGKEQKQSSRALLRVFSDQRKLRILTFSWNRLRANVVRNQTTRTRIKLWEEASSQHRRRRFFHLWKCAVERCKDFRERNERFDRYRGRRNLRQTFVTWATWAERQMTLEKRLSEATKARSEKQICVCFKNWQSYCQEASILDEKLVASVLNVRRLGVWIKWRKLTGTQSATRCLNSAYSLHLSTKVFACWKQHTARKSEIRLVFGEYQQRSKRRLLSNYWKLLVRNLHSQQKKHLAVENVKQRKIREVKRVCLLGWYGYVRRLRECRVRGEQLNFSVSQSLLHSTWTSWRQAFWTQRVSRLADDRLSTYRKLRTFRLWRQFLLGSKHRREREMKVVEMLDSFHLHAGFRQWKELRTMNLQLERKYEMVRRMTFTRRWTIWRHALKTKRKQHEKLSTVTSRWQNRQLYASFHNWKAILRIRQRHRHLLQSTLLTSQHRVLECHFKAWKESWHIAGANEHRILEMQHKLLHFKVKRAIRWWNALRLDQHRRSHLLVKSLAQYRQTLLKSAFQGLLVYKQTRKQQLLQTQLARNRYRENSVRVCFLLWSKWCRSKQKIAKKVEVTKQNLKKMKIKRSIECLKTNSQSRKRLKKAHTCALAMSKGSAQIAMFPRWKTFVARQKNTRALKKKAVVCRYFRLMPLHFGAWKEFLQSRKHNEELLLRARTLWCHQSEHRVFIAWMQFAVNKRQTKRAAAKWKNQAIYKSFVSWKRFLALVKKKQRDQSLAVNFYERQMCHRILKIWHLTTKLNRLTRQCAQMWHQNASRRVFDTWIRHVRLVQSSRKFLARRRNQTLVHVFTAWKASIKQKVQRLQAIQERFLLLWKMSTRSTSFARWKRYAYLRILIRKKLGGQREALLQDILKEWRRMITCLQHSRRCEFLIAERAKLHLIKTLWSNWRTKTRVHRWVKSLRGKVMENRVTYDLRQRLRRWKQFTVLSQAVKQFVCYRELELMRLVFIVGLQRFSQLKHKVRDLAKQIGSVHNEYLKNWLARKLQQRMLIITACENLRQGGSSKRLQTIVWIEWVNFHARKQAQQAAMRQIRVHVSRLEDVNSSLNQTKLSGMLRRWQAIQLARVFERWGSVVQYQQQIRLHTLKAIEWWHKVQCGRHFRDWTQFCLQQKKHRRIRAMNLKFKLKRTWKLWKLFKASSQSKKVINQNARQFHESKVYRSSFDTWKSVATSLCLQRERILELYHSSRLRLLAALLSEWRKFAAMEKTERMQKTVARVVYEEKSVKRSFTEWKTNVAGICYHRHQLQINTERLQVLLLCSSFRAWSSWSLQHKKLRTVMQILTSKGDSRAASRIFTAWHLHAEKNSGLRLKASCFLRFRRMQKGLTGLQKLSQEQQKLRTLCQKAQLFRSALSSNQLVILFARWKQLTNGKQENRDIVERADLHHNNCRLRRALTNWCTQSKENQHFRTVCGNILAKWRLQTGYRTFCALRDHAVYRKVLRASESIVSAKVRTSNLLRAWYAWRKLILILRSGKRRLLQRYFAAWVSSRETRKILQEFQAQIQARVLRSTQLRYLEFWRQFVATRKIEKTMAQMSTAFADTQLVKRMWLCWLQFTSLQKGKTRANSRVRAFRSQKLVTRNFFDWKAVVIERINRRRKLAHYVNLMQHSTQKKSLSAWFAFVCQRKLLYKKMSQALAMRTELCSRMVFQTWKAFVAKVLKNRKSREFCAAKSSANAIKHWKHYVLLCRVEQMISVSELRQIESNFLSWRKAVAATHQIREFQAKSTKKYSLELVGIVFKSWKQQTQTQAHCRKLLANVAIGNRLRFRFMLWERFTAHRKRLANLLLVVADPPNALPVPDKLEVANDSRETTEHQIATIEGELGSIESTFALKEQRSADKLISLGQALAKKARVLQRFEVIWDLPQAWHRWRQLFHAKVFYRMRRLQFNFICWQKFAHQQRRSRYIVIKLTKQRQAASALTVFRAWAELVRRVKQLQKDRLRERELWVLVTTEMARRERRQLKTHWHAWKFHVDEARHLQASLDAYYRARLLTKYWLVWQHDFRQTIRDVRLEKQRSRTHMQSFQLRRAVQSLRNHQQRSKRARLVLEYFGNRRYDSLLPEVFSRWRKWCQRQREIVRCLEAAQVNKTQRHFTAWKTWTNTKKWQRVAVNNLQSKGVEKRRSEVFQRWRRYVKTRLIKDLALQKAVIFHVCSRLRKRWFRHTQRSIQCREQEESAHVQLCVFRGHRAVNRWRDYSRATRLRCLYQRFVLKKHVQLWQSAVKHAVASRFDEFLLRSKAKKMLVAWKQVAAKNHYWRQICATFAGEKEMQIARRVFLRWQQLVNVRQVRQLAILHADQSTLRRMWRCWSRMTRISHKQLAQAVEHETLSLLRQSFQTWQIGAKKQRERRFVLLSCVVKLQSVAGQRVQQVIFREWKLLVERERRCQIAAIKHDCNMAKRALTFWSLRTRNRMQMRQQLENAAKYHSQRLQSAVFFYWQTYALAWQDAAKPIARRQNLPAKLVAEPRNSDKCEDSDDSETSVRRPTSPVMKRLRQKKANRTRSAEGVANSSDMVTLPDAVEISMDVKKRLLLLGKWKPQQNGNKLLSFSS